MGLRTPRWAHRCSGDRSESRRATRQGALPGSVVLGRRAISTLVAADRGVRWSGLMDCRRGRRQLERRRLQLDWRLCGVLYRRVRSGEHEPLMAVGVAHEVWRRPVLSPNLDDLRRLVGRAAHPAVHVDRSPTTARMPTPLNSARQAWHGRPRRCPAASPRHPLDARTGPRWRQEAANGTRTPPRGRAPAPPGRSATGRVFLRPGLSLRLALRQPQSTPSRSWPIYDCAAARRVEAQVPVFYPSLIVSDSRGRTHQTA